MSERLFGGAGATVDSVPELGAALASRTAAANPMMWGDVMACLALEKSTYVLRSTAFESKPVHQRLKTGLAMTLCCSAKTPNKRVLISKTCSIGTWASPSIVRMIPIFPRNAIA